MPKIMVSLRFIFYMENWNLASRRLSGNSKESTLSFVNYLKRSNTLTLVIFYFSHLFPAPSGIRWSMTLLLLAQRTMK